MDGLVGMCGFRCFRVASVLDGEECRVAAGFANDVQNG